MKNIYTILIFIVLILLLTFVSYQWYEIRQDRNRVRDNQTYLLNDLKTYVKTLHKDEWKEYVRGQVQVDSLLKSLHIRSKQVDRYVEYAYKFKDTVLTSFVSSSSDTVGRMYFNVEKDCYTLSGEVIEGKINTTLTVSDTLTSVFYWQRREGWLGIKWPWGRKENKLITVSKCSGDTVQIGRNIEVVKD